MKPLIASFYRYGALRSTGLILFAVLGALLAISAWRSSVDAHNRAQAEHSQAQDTLRSATLFQQSHLAQAQAVLDVLSGIALSRPRNAATCDTFLARQLERFPQYNNLAFTGTKGAVWCSAKPFSTTLALPAMTTLQKPSLLALPDYSLGFALPQFSTDGRWQGAVIAIMSVQDFFPALADNQPAGKVFGIADAQGKLLLTYPALDENNATAKRKDFWQTSRPISGSAGNLRLLLHLPTPRFAWELYGSVLLFLILGAAATWRFGHRQGVKVFARYVRDKIQPLFPQTTKQSPSNTQLLRGAYAELKGAFLQKEARVQQLVQLDELSQRLQSCGSTTEWADTVARCAQAIFPNCHGALYLRASSEHYGLALAWGGGTLMQSLQVHDCHALHSDRPYASHGAKDSACAHANCAEHYACVPLQTSTGCLGLLYLAHLHAPSAQRTPPWAATAIAERATIGLTALRRQEQLHLRAIRDALTGLFNRGFMEEALAIEQQQALRRDACIGIMMLDVDHFKRYNDNYGHAAGDTLLRGIGKLIQQTVREGDMPCRYGGEEFVVILPGADLENTKQRAETLRLAIERWRPSSSGQVLGEVTVSVGVAAFPAQGVTWQAVLKCADDALYAAKHAGRNRVVVATPAMQAAMTA